jgi:hypothetical protein
MLLHDHRRGLCHAPWRADDAIVVEDTSSHAFASSHGIRDEFLSVIVPNKHYDFIISYRLLVLLL